MRELKIDLGDHRTIVTSTGPRNRRPVVFIHSAVLDQRLWNSVVPALPGRHAIRYDVRGHGRAHTEQAAITSLDQLVNDLVSILDAVHAEQADIVGLSLGGLIGQRLGALHPERAHSLHLMATASVLPSQPLLDRASELDAMGREATITATLERWFGTATPTLPLAYARECLNSVRPADWSAVWTAMAGVDLRGGLQDYRGLVTCVAGGADTSTPPAAMRELATTAPNSTFVAIDNAPHLFPLTHLDETVTTVIAHLHNC